MNLPSTDNGIPLLTEVIAAPAAPSPSPRPATPTAQSEPLAAAVHPDPSQEQWRQMQQDIHESVLQQLLGQVDTVLHQHLQDHLAVVLDNLADILKSRVRASLEQALAESVKQALAEEMGQFKNAKK